MEFKILDVEGIKKLPAKLFREWQLYFQMEPFTHQRMGYYAAQIACTFANIHRGPDQEPYKISDIVLDFSGDRHKRQRMSLDEQARYLTVIAKAHQPD